MLKKFVTIKNVSRFKNFSARGDIELKRLSLLFAENGRGKTTLCAVLRSLQSGVGAHVIGRTTGTEPVVTNLRPALHYDRRARDRWIDRISEADELRLRAARTTRAPAARCTWLRDRLLTHVVRSVARGSASAALDARTSRRGGTSQLALG